MSEKEIINKVAQSPLITFNLEDYLPPRTAELDLCTLVEGGLLREEAFRNTLKAHDFSAYENAVVRLYLSEDLILPAWALSCSRADWQTWASPVFGRPIPKRFGASISGRLWENWTTAPSQANPSSSKVVGTNAFHAMLTCKPYNTSNPSQKK
jgi:hypothetical protein